MQTRTKNALVFAAAAAVLGAALAVVSRVRGGGASPGALDAVPAGAILVAVADLAALRASPVGAPFLREGREIPGLGKVRDVCGFDPLDTIREVAVAVPASGDAGEFGLVAVGALDADALVACASKVIDARGGKAEVTPLGGFRAVRDSTLPAGSGEIAVRRGGPLLLGAGAYLHAMIDSAEGRAPTIRASAAHSQLARQIGDATVRVSVVLTPEQRRSLAEESASDGAASSPAASVVAGALGVQLGPTVALHAVIACEEPDACARFAETLKAARDVRAADLSTRLVGIGALLEQLRIEPEGSLVQLRVSAPSAEAAVLVDRVLKLRGFSHPMPPAVATALPGDEVIPAPKKER